MKPKGNKKNKLAVSFAKGGPWTQISLNPVQEQLQAGLAASENGLELKRRQI
jgi:hypothetical protein